MSYLERQIATLALSHVRLANPMAAARAASWHNLVSGMGVHLPLFVIHDVGLLLTAPRGAGGASLSPRPIVPPGAPAAATALLSRYRELLERIAASEVAEKAASWRLRDELVGVLLLRILGDVYTRWQHRGKAVGAGPLPLDPEVYNSASPAAELRRLDARFLWDFLETLARLAWHVYSSVEQIDLDTLRLLGIFSGKEEAGGIGSALEIPDLYAALGSADANDVVNFSLDLLPSVLETKRASGAQTFSMDGYASIERRGNVDSLVLSEFAVDEDLFDRKVVDQELYYYGHEMEREEERRLHYILVDASASMRGERQVFARGLALTMAKKLSLAGDEVWLRFFDSRLYDVVKVARAGSVSVPYLLSFRSERGRHYAKVFRQLLLELTVLKREARRAVVVHLVTHGQCHIPVEVVIALKKLVTLDAVIILPSSEVVLDWLAIADRHHVITAENLASPAARKSSALDIVDRA